MIMKNIFICLLIVPLLAACQKPQQAAYVEPITNPGLTVIGPHEDSPVVVRNVDSDQRPSGGIYLKNSDHGAVMTDNIVRQMPARR